MLEGLLIAAATGGDYQGYNDQVYQTLRREFLNDPVINKRLPDFVRIYRNLPSFWPYIKELHSTYAERRQFIYTAFTPLIDTLEGGLNSPGDSSLSSNLKTLSSEYVSTIWEKAISRRETDPEGAITLARTLLEGVIKRILSDLGESFDPTDDLPKLYNKLAKSLNLAPSQHSLEPIKAILGGAFTVVNGLGTLRNRFSDAHAPAEHAPVRPSKRHAALAVNVAGAVATFLVETHLEKRR